MDLTQNVINEINAIALNLDRLEDLVLTPLCDYIALSDDQDFADTITVRHAAQELRQLINDQNASLEALAQELGVAL